MVSDERGSNLVVKPAKRKKVESALPQEAKSGLDFTPSDDEGPVSEDGRQKDD